jgi:arabinan endo-1,5-alpha-L-arabinosidase
VVTVVSVSEQPGLEVDLRFDEDQGSVAKDMSKYGRHVFLTGVSWNSTGKAGSALQFDSTGGYAEALGYKGVLGTQSRTVSMWINTSVQADMDLVSWGVDQSGALWALSIIKGGGRSLPSGVLKLDIGEGWTVGQTSMLDGQWHHIAVVLPMSQSPRMQDVQIYVDGQIESNNMFQDVAVNTLTGSDVRLGMRAGNSLTPYDGLMDELRIYSRALTPEEIAELAGVTE